MTQRAFKKPVRQIGFYSSLGKNTCSNMNNPTVPVRVQDTGFHRGEWGSMKKRDSFSPEKVTKIGGALHLGKGSDLRGAISLPSLR